MSSPAQTPAGQREREIKMKKKKGAGWIQNVKKIENAGAGKKIDGGRERRGEVLRSSEQRRRGTK